MRKPRRSLPRQMFDVSFFAFIAVGIVAAIATWEWKGPEVVAEVLAYDFEIITFLFPRILGGMLLAALVQVLLPPEFVARWVGENSGLKGVVIAACAGALTPGGPMTSFPIVVAFYMSGADRGALVAYVTGWSLLGFQRMLIWELPLLGPEITLYRIAAVLVLPVLAGLLARRLPIAMPVPARPDSDERDGAGRSGREGGR